MEITLSYKGSTRKVFSFSPVFNNKVFEASNLNTIDGINAFIKFYSE